MIELSVDSIRSVQKTLSSLYTRMDEDKSLYLLDKFILKDWKGKEVSHVHNITLNAPAVYADQVKGHLGTADQQVIVEGDGISGREARKVEEFIEACLADIDCRLDQEGISLMAYAIEQSCIRGRIVARCVVRQEDNDAPFIELSPWDSRYMAYYFADHSMRWGSYTTEREAGDIEEQYDVGSLGGSQATVIDAWDRNVNKVWVGNREIFSQTHSLGWVPIALAFVPTGSMLIDEDGGQKYKGESVYYLCRTLFPELNKLATVLQTLTMRAIRPPAERKSQEGENAAPLDEYPFDEAAVYNVDIGGGITPAQLPDIQQATRLWYSILESYIQRGTLSTIDYGNLTFPLSGSAIAALMATNEPLFWPRLQALSMFYRQISRMFLKWLNIYGELEVGEEGHKRLFRASDMQGNYTIKFKYFTKSPLEDIGRFSMATQAQPFLDEDTIRREILRVRDPDAIKAKRDADMAAKIDPAIALIRLVHSLIDEAANDDYKDIEARLAFDRLKALMMQRHQPGPTPLDQQIGDAAKPPQAQGALPMFPGQAGAPAQQQEPPTRQQLQEEDNEQTNTQRS